MLVFSVVHLRLVGDFLFSFAHWRMARTGEEVSQHHEQFWRAIFICFVGVRTRLWACELSELFVRFDSAGIGLSVFPLFRFFHPRLFIPWSAVSDCKQERHWFMNFTAVYVSEPSVRMLFRGRLGRELYEFRNQVA
jgi:hypothetical protein